MLKEKQILINYILKEEPNYQLGGKKLKEFTDEEKVLISYNFFFKIKDWLKTKKVDKTRELLDKKFEKYDYFIRR